MLDVNIHDRYTLASSHLVNLHFGRSMAPMRSSLGQAIRRGTVCNQRVAPEKAQLGIRPHKLSDPASIESIQAKCLEIWFTQF